MARYIINLSAFLLMVGVGMIVALLPQKIIYLSGTVSSVGYLASAFALTFVLIQIPIGKLSDRFGFKPFIVSGYFICAGSLSGIWVAKIWQGNEAFLLFTGMSFIGGLLIVLFVKDPEKKSNAVAAKSVIKRTPDKGTLLSLASKPENGVVFAGILLYGAGYGIFVTMIPGFLISVKQSDQTLVGIFYVLFYIAVSLSQLVAGPISDHRGRKPVILAGLATAIVGMALFSGFSLPWLLAFLTLAAFGLGTYCVSALAFLNERVSDELKGTISGAFYFFWGIGYFAGPLLLGARVKGAFGQPAAWQAGFKILAVLFVIELIGCIVLLNRQTETQIPKLRYRKK